MKVLLGNLLSEQRRTVTGVDIKFKLMSKLRKSQYRTVSTCRNPPQTPTQPGRRGGQDESEKWCGKMTNISFLFGTMSLALSDTSCPPHLLVGCEIPDISALFIGVSH